MITPTWSFQNETLDSELGGTVAGVGDVNGDGYDDVMVAGTRYANPDPSEGIAYLFLGSATGPSLTPDWQREGGMTYMQFGWDIHAAGDVNADGFGDVIISAPFYYREWNHQGIVFMFFGSSAGLLDEPVYTLRGGMENTGLGWSSDTAGDVNNDGFDDRIVGTMHFNTRYGDPGKADVFYARMHAAYRSLLPVILR